jgi:hypothetical protein
MSCNEAILGPDGQIEKLKCEGTTLLGSVVNTDENEAAAAVRNQDSAQNNKTGSSKEDHVCTICKYFGEFSYNWQISAGYMS